MEGQWIAGIIFIVSTMLCSASNPGNLRLNKRPNPRNVPKMSKCFQMCRKSHPKTPAVKNYIGRPKHIGYKGRPFIVEGASRTANSQTCNFEKNCDSLKWTMGETPSVMANASVNQEIGRRWLEQAEGEHASVASFARNTLQLMAIGAPPDLLIASQNAAVDEIRHAKLSYGFAREFLKSDFGPGPLDIEGSLPKLDLKGLVHSIIEEGCIEETISAAKARFGAYTAKEPAIKRALTQIGDDETRHAQLAWDTIQWIITKFPEVRKFVEDIFEVELKNRSPPLDNNFNEMPTTLCLENDIHTALRNHGILVDGDQVTIRKAVIQNVIKPIYQSGFNDVSLISKELMNMDFSVV